MAWGTRGTARPTWPCGTGRRCTCGRAVRAFFELLSPESTALRFFSGFPNLDSAVAWATQVDYRRRYSLLATGGDGRVLAHAGWERDPDDPDRAEVALAAADALQGRGLGTILLGQLAEVADQAGIGVLGAEVLPRSVAVIGASRRRGTVGAELFHNLLAAGFTGPVYPVNPNTPVVQSVVAYPSIAEVPGPVDLAVVAVPAPAVV
jgi:GNAT superfamily N-acetyltransferase